MRVVEPETRHYARGSKSNPRKNAYQPSTIHPSVISRPQSESKEALEGFFEPPTIGLRVPPPDSQIARPGGPPLPSFQGFHHAIVQRSNQFRQNLHQYPSQSTAFYLVYPSHGEIYQTPF